MRPVLGLVVAVVVGGALGLLYDTVIERAIAKVNEAIAQIEEADL